MSKRILLADDEFEIRDISRTILEDSGYEVALATDGKEAMEMINKEKFDLYLLDMMMPHYNGLEITKAIKKKYPLAIIIIITGFSSIDGAVEAVHAGAFKYLAKPIDPKEMLKQISRGLKYSEELYGFDEKINTNVLKKSKHQEFTIFTGFTQDQKDEILKLGNRIEYKIGDDIFGFNSSIILVEKGEISVLLSNSTVDHLEEGDSIGGETIVFNPKREYQLNVKSDVTIIEIKSTVLLNYFSEDRGQLFMKFKNNLIVEGYRKWRKAVQRILLLKMVSED